MRLQNIEPDVLSRRFTRAHIHFLLLAHSVLFIIRPLILYLEGTKKERFSRKESLYLYAPGFVYSTIEQFSK